MAFNQKTWENRVSEQPQRRLLTPTDGGTAYTVDVTRQEGIVIQEGDAFSAENMNDLESRINSTFTADEATLSTVNQKANTNASNISTLQSNVNTLNSSKAPNNHASSATTYGKGSTSAFGHLKISDNYTSSAGNASDGVAASSAAVNNARTDIINELTANSNRIYMDYKDGKYGINTSANRGADTFIPFKSGYTIPTLWARADGDNRACETEYTFDVSEYNYFKVQSIVSNYGIGECIFYKDGTNIGGSSLINTQIDVSSASTLKIHASGNVGDSFTTVTYTNIQVYN